jgi:two-component system, LytTR family, sensor kinase
MGQRPMIAHTILRGCDTAGMFRRATSSDLSDRSRLAVLQSVNAASQALRGGFDASSARTVASTVRQMLDAGGVAVVQDGRVLAAIGDAAWAEALAERATDALERQRSPRPAMLQIDLRGGSGPDEVAIGALVVDGEPVAGVLIAVDEGSPRVLRELSELLTLFSAQLEFAELARARSDAAEAELRALRSQVSPHFVHNSLAAIAGLIHDDPERARELLSSFAEFLRSSFRRHDEFVTVADELRLTELYLELESARFGGRLAVSLQIDPEVLPVRVPILTLQPLVENSIRHGLEQRPGGGRVRIVGSDLGLEIELVVDDDGVGTDPVALDGALRGEQSSRHIGVLAVDERLRLAFGAEHGLVIATAPGSGTTVTVRIPKFVASV